MIRSKTGKCIIGLIDNCPRYFYPFSQGINCFKSNSSINVHDQISSFGHELHINIVRIWWKCRRRHIRAKHPHIAAKEKIFREILHPIGVRTHLIFTCL